MKAAATLSLLVALTTAAAANAAKPLPASRYWTTTQANAATIAQATIPYCKVMQCVNGQPSIAGNPTGSPATPFKVAASQCSGLAAFAKAGKFSQFTCKYSTINDMSVGTLQVLTASATAIRWKKI